MATFFQGQQFQSPGRLPDNNDQFSSMLAGLVNLERQKSANRASNRNQLINTGGNLANTQLQNRLQIRQGDRLAEVLGNETLKGLDPATQRSLLNNKFVVSQFNQGIQDRLAANNAGTLAKNNPGDKPIELGAQGKIDNFLNPGGATPGVQVQTNPVASPPGFTNAGGSPTPIGQFPFANNNVDPSALGNTLSPEEQANLDAFAQAAQQNQLSGGVTAFDTPGARDTFNRPAQVGLEKGELDVDQKKREKQVRDSDFNRGTFGGTVIFNDRPSEIPIGDLEQGLIQEGQNQALKAPATYSKDQAFTRKQSIAIKDKLLPSMQRVKNAVNKYGDLQVLYNIAEVGDKFNMGKYLEQASRIIGNQASPQEMRQLALDIRTMKSFRPQYVKDAGDAGNLSQSDLAAFDFLAEAGQFLDPQNIGLLDGKIKEYLQSNLYQNGIKYNVREAAELGFALQGQERNTPNSQFVPTPGSQQTGVPDRNKILELIRQKQVGVAR